mmetsp:Transcript_5982/g.15313  ORF Transcript_5982/g.15313 Transcript_5982/m.15313 type:complete len:312 (-) Transcript_5982:88-1023(-)
MADEEPSPLDATLVVAVVDVNPYVWAARQNGNSSGHLALSRILEQLCMFLNAVRIVNAENRIAVVAAYPGGARMILGANTRVPGRLHDSLVPELLQVAAGAAEPRETTTTALSSALSIALCHAHKHAPPDARHQRAQILTLAATVDDTRQYNSAMNCIFAAQRASILVDACMLGAPSAFLQQAAHITHGVYLQPDPAAEQALSQLLISVVLPDAFTRMQLRPPPPHDVDFRAACFLTAEMLERAYVCSVCLSVFHRGAMPECPACRARFRPPAVGRLGKRKRRGPTGGDGSVPAGDPTRATPPPSASAGAM